jgi:ribose transport system ATP-binding protein
VKGGSEAAVEDDGRCQSSVIEMRGIAKRFGETRVLTSVDFTLVPGTVHGIIGANGAGKTTLMRVLMGETRADAGTFTFNNTTLSAGDWRGVETAGGGVAMVHQEVPVFDNLRIYEHFALEEGSPSRRRGWRSRARRRAGEIMTRLFPGSHVVPDAMVSDLNLGRRQMLDIALAMSTPGLQFLVLDEPTSALDRDQAEQLKDAVRQLRRSGVAVVVVSHRLEELLTLCDVVTVLRDGKVARTGTASEFDADSLIVAMGGEAHQPADEPIQDGTRTVSPEADLVAWLRPGGDSGLPVEVRRGEIVGLAGLSGSGQSELITAVVQHRRSRSMTVKGRAALVTGDRRGSGIFQLWSIVRNVTILSLRSVGLFGSVLPRAERDLYGRWKDELQIRSSNPSDLITTLSGGTQQKVLIARALAANPDVLVLDDPTRGVDASTRRDLYQLLRERAANGMAVLWYSTEDDEMLRCDRVYVMHDGVVVKELAGTALTRQSIVAASFALTELRNESGEEATTRHWRHTGVAALRGWFLIGAVLAVLIVLTGIADPTALSLSGLPVLVSSFTPLVLATAAELMIIAVSDIDLGVGAFMGLVNAISATWLAHNALLGALAIVGCIVLYACQALVVAIRQVPAIIVTLGFSFIWLGLGLIILPVPGGLSPGWLTAIGNATIPVVPEPLIISVVVGALAALFMYRTRLGVRIRAVGNNADSYTVRTGSTWAAVRERVIAWSIAGVFAALAGLSVTALTSSADPTASQPDTLLAIAGVIVGGGLFIGGIVEPVGAILGALMFGLLQAYLSLISINVNYTFLVEGTVLIGVLGLRLFARPRTGAATTAQRGRTRYRRMRLVLPSGVARASKTDVR